VCPPFFKLKPFISFLTTFSFLALAFSGFILYLRPEGSLARWVGWRALGLDKSVWEGMHLIFCVLFVLAAVVHLTLNFKAIIAYLKTGINNGRKNILEMAAALLLVGLLLLTALLQVPPASWLAAGRASFKNHPGALRIEMPFPGFEKQSLRRVAEHFGLSPASVIRELEALGLKGLYLKSSLEDVARQNQLTPQELYLLICPY
jgi:hypothetical protein